MKRLTTITLALTLALVLSTIAAAQSPSNWALDEVTKATELGLVPEALQADYQAAITREEFCVLAMVLWSRYSDQANDLAASENPFADTDNPSVLAAYELGIVTGKSDDIFDPDGSILRQESAAMLARMAEALGIDIARTPTVTFADSNRIASYAINPVNFVAAEGIMTGVGESMFSPLGTYTREQSILTIVRLYDVLYVELAVAVPVVPDEVQAVREAVVGLAELYGKQLDGEWGDLHAALIESGEGEDFESFEAMKTILDDIRIECGAYYVYAFYPSGDPESSDYYITVDGSEDPDEFGTLYHWEIQFAEAWSGTPSPARSAWDNDENDPVWSAFAPIHDSEDNIVAILGIDIPVPGILDYPEWNRDSETWNGIVE